MRSLPLVALALVVASGGPSLAAGGARPDLVIFLADDLGPLDSSPYGARELRTPNMQLRACAEPGLALPSLPPGLVPRCGAHQRLARVHPAVGMRLLLVVLFHVSPQPHRELL